ncbi:alpha/beta-type small acid-soluble spore protein [Ammoniphilus sp. YIM 78166]|uniref:alpha/beta-type small acid-soluble spore protein n=1 Tax=Ammoniphilus sp. YIM 78166 TaxID=1644106 RepID=UPI0010706719|nr:alpha/beta-type small acid-soluble spore protein [Ammoniphilus sp. YIM 78166]
MYIQQVQENNNNQKLVPSAGLALDAMKFEIAQEFGIQLGAEQTARANGAVGGEITKRLVQFAEQALASSHIVH